MMAGEIIFSPGWFSAAPVLKNGSAICHCFCKVKKQDGAAAGISFCLRYFVGMKQLFLLDFKPRWGILALFLAFSLYLVAGKNWLKSRWPIQMDANGYYLYLPAMFIYDDLRNLAFVDEMPEQFDRRYFLYQGSSGGYMTKYSPGMAILELPFFLTAHGIALSAGLEADGYSPVYRLFIAISSLFYSCLGLWILAMVLARYFSRQLVNTLIICLFLGSNLFFSTIIQAGVTHNYLFFVFAMLLYFLDNWRLCGKIMDFALACACVGFSALIRPTEILIGIVPLVVFWVIAKPEPALPWFRKNVPVLAAGLAAFLLFLSPVFFYWKYATGHWIAYTYEQEGFYFDRPSQLWYGLFGFRKGWFIYTPVAALALAGWRTMKRSREFGPLATAILFYLPVNLYIVLSWYGWWYGGCFGNRALVPVLALLAIPLAFFIRQCQESGRKWVSGLLVLLVFLNVFQTFQYQRRIMHMDAMTWKAYWFIFGKWKLSPEEQQHLNTLLDHPDYSQRGKKLDEYFR